MKTKLTALLMALLLMALSGCSLARETGGQETGETARFVGVYVVREDLNDQLDRSGWTEYGSIQVDSDMGRLEVPREILVAVQDEATHTVCFPGLKGMALFAYRQTDASGNSYISHYCDLSDTSFVFGTTDTGESYDLSGTLYYGPPADDPDYDPAQDSRVWHHYMVFQMADGTIYLDGSGDAHIGGGGVNLTQTVTDTVTVNGETLEYSTRVAVRVEYTQRLTGLSVCQYGADSVLLCRETLPVEGEIPAVSWLPEAAWLTVEETRGDEVSRTLYDRPEEGEEVAHGLVLLDEDGLGRSVTLTIR